MTDDSSCRLSNEQKLSIETADWSGISETC